MNSGKKNWGADTLADLCQHSFRNCPQVQSTFRSCRARRGSWTRSS